MTRRELLGAVAGAAPMIAPIRSARPRDPFGSVPRVVAGPERSRVLNDLVERFEALVGPLAVEIKEGVGLSERYWQQHGGNPKSCRGPQDCRKCQTPELKALADLEWQSDEQSDEQAGAIAKRREAIYRTIWGEVIEILEDAGHDREQDLADWLESCSRVQAVVESSSRMFLVVMATIPGNAIDDTYYHQDRWSFSEILIV